MRQHRTMLAILLATLLIGIGLVATSPVTAQQSIGVFLNGQALAFDVPPTVVSGRTLVPLRTIFEALGAEVDWNQDTRTATASWSGGSLGLTIGSSSATVNGAAKPLDVPGQIVNGRTLVPLRFIAEAMGTQVGWYRHSRTITINLPPKPLVQATVSRVVDGDTVEVALTDGSTEKVRLIGVDTPETVHPTRGEEPYGKQASDFVKEHFAGQLVLLETDVEERDRYGRLLAYMYLPNGIMVNALLVDEGYAQMATFPPNVRYVEVFHAFQTSAREGNLGLWGLAQNQAPVAEPPTDQPPAATGLFAPDAAGNCVKDGREHIKGNRDSMVYHLPAGQFYSRTQAEECFTTEEAAQAAGYRRSQR